MNNEKNGVKGMKNETVSPTNEHVHKFSETYSYDKTKHWKYCSCGEKNNEGEHLFGAWILVEDSSNEKSKKRICSICGYEQIKNEEVSEHTHVFSVEWKKDDTYHWNECSCGEKTNIEIHNGALNKNCKCGYLITGSKGLNYTLLADDTYEVSGKGECKDSDIVIPRIYDGRIVTSIGSSAFAECSSLTSIEIPNSVTSIGSDAFAECSSLTSIEIPNSVTSIGYSAFYYCSSLTSVTIGNSVTSIGSYAFTGCSSLVYNEYDSAYYLGNDINPYLVLVEAKSTDITSCKINENTKIIGSNAFSGCSSLTSIEILNSVTSIGIYAFSRCSSLKSISVDENNEYYDSRNNCNAIIETLTNTLIVGCVNTKIPDSVTSIGSNAFSGCSSLTSIEIPNSVTSIGSSAFSGCSSLTSIEIPNSVTSIGTNVFYRCSSLVYNEYDDAYYLGNDTNPYLVLVEAKSTDITSCKINENTKIIGSYAFLDCSSLTSIVIPNSVTSIGDFAFRGCSSLTSVTIGNSVTSIGSNAFEFCSSLTSIEIPNSVTSIGSNAFLNCSSLTSIIIPNSVTSIGSYAFFGCSSLTSVYYKGTSSEWNSISTNYFGNSYLINANIYYYSETKPTDTTNKYWHYVDGVITIW